LRINETDKRTQTSIWGFKRRVDKEREWGKRFAELSDGGGVERRKRENPPSA